MEDNRMNSRFISVYIASLGLFIGSIAHSGPIDMLGHAQQGAKYVFLTAVRPAAFGMPLSGPLVQKEQSQLIKFICSDGYIKVPTIIGKKLGFVRDAIKDSTVELKDKKIAEAEFDLTIFGEHTPCKKNLQLLFDSIEKPADINLLSAEQIDSLMSIIPVLCPAKDICNTIIARSNFLKGPGKNIEYIMPVKYALSFFREYNSKNGKQMLDLKNKNLMNLDILSEYASDDVWAINLSNNKLLSLDLVKMKEYFPNLGVVLASNNTIKKLTAADLAASSGLIVDLDSNQITTIDKIITYNAPEYGTLILTNNPLSELARKNITSFLKPSMWQKIRGRVSLGCNSTAQVIQSINSFFGMVPVSVKGVHMSIPLGIAHWLYYKIAQRDREFMIEFWKKRKELPEYKDNVEILEEAIKLVSAERIAATKNNVFIYGSFQTAVVTALGRSFFDFSKLKSGILSMSNLAMIALAQKYSLRDKPDITKYYLLLAALPTALSACSYYALQNFGEFKPTQLHMSNTKILNTNKKTSLEYLD